MGVGSEVSNQRPSLAFSLLSACGSDVSSVTAPAPCLFPTIMEVYKPSGTVSQPLITCFSLQSG